ncbi:MAG: sigma-54-dependent Fis family transcriptional regulator [Ignavibacteria bacterium]|jgi:DNA-binding NtrC family response regulator|nr:sigma-54-dependent Fis family transcriptional regulator [Ignavibacteria bacterium]
MAKILIVDDNKFIRYTLTTLLEDADYQCTQASDGFAAIKEVKETFYDLVILDMKLPGLSGREIFYEIKKSDPDVPVIFLTAFGDIQDAVDLMKKGAYHYVTKPFNNDEILILINKAIENRYLNKEINILRKKLDEGNDDIIGKSPEMNSVFNQVNIVAPTDLTVVIHGESGTGKEVIANLIHQKSERKDGPFIAVDCGAIPETLIESELFGHEKGAFTGADNMKQGKFELANNGTIFLDEITNLSDPNQVKLLRVIQERKLTRLGGKTNIPINIRIIVASNIRLAEFVNKKRFRHDLYYRLNEYNIDMPPLRSRISDIPLFATFFINKCNKEFNKNVQGVSEDVMKELMDYDWPGNVRELRNVMRRAILMAGNEVITNIQIPKEINYHLDSDSEGMITNNLEDSKKNIEKEFIINALKETGGNKSKAAKLLNMNERTFYRKLKLYNL